MSASAWLPILEASRKHFAKRDVESVTSAPPQPGSETRPEPEQVLWRCLFHLIQGKTVIGTGANRLEIYLFYGETTERQMMIYFPQHQLLYRSDAFQQSADGSFFYPQTVTELMDAVVREHLDVNQFSLMHIAPAPSAALAKVVATATTKDTPNGVL